MIKEMPKIVVEHVDGKVLTANEIHERLKKADELIDSGEIKEAEKIIKELEPYIEFRTEDVAQDVAQDDDHDSEEIFRMMMEEKKNNNDV